jgi:hypothetical protein
MKEIDDLMKDSIRMAKKSSVYFGIFCLALVILLLISGCGHNVLTYTTGKRLNIGFNPQTSETGVQYLDAEQISVIEKDNAKLTVEMEDALDADGKVTRKVSKIIYEIKEQITGADVELETVKK